MNLIRSMRVRACRFQDANSNLAFAVTFVGFRKESVTMNAKSIIQNVKSAIHAYTEPHACKHTHTRIVLNSHLFFLIS